jgi:hypothetical protein
MPMKPAVAVPLPQLTLASFGILQRKCACGGSAGAGDGCEECKKKEATLQRSSVGQAAPAAIPPIVREVLSPSWQPLNAATRANLGPRFGHDFSRVRVHDGGQGDGRPRGLPKIGPLAGYFPPILMSSPRPSFELAAGASERPEYSPDGVRMSLQSGTCQNGGGSSVCNMNTGNYDIVAIGNTCCTKDCTRQHEQTHVTDINASGCCKAASTAYNAKGADKNVVVNKYNAWLASADPVTECHAYNVGVACAEGLAKAKDCDGKGKGTDCCKDIVAYKSYYGGLANSTCKTAAAKMPPCPAF